MSKKKFSLKSLATYAKGRLVLDLAAANPPGVLVLDIKDIPYAHYQVRQLDHGAALGYGNGKGDFIALANFPSAEEAAQVLAHIKAAHFFLNDLLRLLVKVILAVVAIMAFLFALNALLGALFPSPALYAPDTYAPDTMRMEAPIEGGMPLDADEKFKGME
jgi:hypothetical protein